MNANSETISCKIVINKSATAFYKTVTKRQRQINKNSKLLIYDST